jgi:hypothetical protein
MSLRGRQCKFEQDHLESTYRSRFFTFAITQIIKIAVILFMIIYWRIVTVLISGLFFGGRVFITKASRNEPFSPMSFRILTSTSCLFRTSKELRY